MYIVNVCALLVTLCSAQNNTADSADVETRCAVCDVILLHSYTVLRHNLHFALYMFSLMTAQHGRNM